MKKYIWLFLISGVICAAFLMLPYTVRFGVTRVVLTRPAEVSLQKSVYANGVIGQEIQTEITSDIPVVIKKALRSTGDEVRSGEVIATVDRDATKDAILSLIKAASLIPEEYAGILSEVDIDESLLSAVIPESITANASGILISSKLYEGALVMPKESAAVIGNSDDLILKLTVFEEDIESVQKGDTVVFKAKATGDKTYAAVVTRIADSAQTSFSGASQRTAVCVYAKVCPSENTLKSGYNVTAEIKDGDTKENKAKLIPYEAVLQDENGVEYVYVYENESAVRKDILSADDLKEGVAVETGLSGSELIVENAADIPYDGAAVIWRDEDE